ncbi:hypothetical protein [Streptosporangium sp. KLBMP 9127]|nr:hypothetical protein [Streptosporangium sp. KLBMP 9127]
MWFMWRFVIELNAPLAAGERKAARRSRLSYGEALGGAGDQVFYRHGKLIFTSAPGGAGN